MKIRRAIPPVATPIHVSELVHGVIGIFSGDIEEKIEHELKQYFEVKHVYLVSSGKAALVVILSALKKIRDKGYVIIPSYTCYSVPAAIKMAGLKIKLCDIDPETLDYDYEMLDKLVDDDVLGILSTHLFSIPSNTSEIKKLYGEKGLFIIEDAAQAMGGISQGKKLGTLGDVGFFSLGRGKNINTGTGGIILTSSDSISDAVKEIYMALKKEPIGKLMKNIVHILFQHIFINPKLYWFPMQLSFLGIGETIYSENISINRLSKFNMGLLHKWQSRLERFNVVRKIIGKFYVDRIIKSKVIGIYSESYPYLRFPVYTSSLEKKVFLCKEYPWLGVSNMYPDSINDIKEIADNFKGFNYPGADFVVEHLVTLPTHCFVSEKDKNIIAEALSS